MTTMTEARDDLLALVVNAISGVSYIPHNIVGGQRGSPATAIELRFQGVENEKLPPTTLPWARLFVQHNDGDQRSLGPIGSRRFERLGLFTIQIFVPISDAQCLSLSETYATVVRNAVEGVHTPHDVWLRRVRVQDVGTGENLTEWYQTNVFASFEYQETR